MDSYRLVACGFHDELEALATLHKPCQIIYRDSDKEVHTVETQIVDVYSADRADFIKLQDGTVIRLDLLISVDGKPIQFARLPFSCS